MRQCAFCGTNITGGNRNTKYCSIKCRKKEAVRLRDGRGIIWRSSKVCKCAKCGIEFRPKLNGRNVGKYCSRECYFKSNCGRPKKERVGGYRVGRHTRINIISCVECSRLFISKWKNKTLCSYKCSVARHAQAAAFKHNGKMYGITIQCKECGEDFKIVYGNGNRVFCSWECKELFSRRAWRASDGYKTSKRKRERLERDSAPWGCKTHGVKLEYIFTRDKGVCQLCGGKVDPSLKVPSRMAATRDHIVPLICGGRNTPENVQLAHLRCNSKKGARGTGRGVQPWLISPTLNTDKPMNPGG